ncbi:hypothetical protein [Luteimonas panaciterrae]|uniref:hypothetical protein n=1 Tax=Luteimonas panaciterrae TaxID=363885 RepID=UPI001CF9B8EA|nr:hypothetical protein [Luteimonas panaciterrae]
MTKLQLLIFGLISSLALGASAQDSTRFVSDRPSPLKRAGVIEPNETTFSGDVHVSGTFEVFWEPSSEGYLGYYRVALKPNKTSQQVLPHDSERGLVREIWLRNTDEAIRAFLSQPQREALSASRTRHVTGKVATLLTSYQTGVDCDQRNYSALLVSIIQQPALVAIATKARDEPSGC